MNVQCAKIAYIAGKTSQNAVFIFRKKVVPIRLSRRKRPVNVSWPWPQEGTAGSSHARQLYAEEEEPE